MFGWVDRLTVDAGTEIWGVTFHKWQLFKGYGELCSVIKEETW